MIRRTLLILSLTLAIVIGCVCGLSYGRELVIWSTGAWPPLSQPVVTPIPQGQQPAQISQVMATLSAMPQGPGKSLSPAKPTGDTGSIEAATQSASRIRVVLPPISSGRSEPSLVKHISIQTGDLWRSPTVPRNPDEVQVPLPDKRLSIANGTLQYAHKAIISPGAAMGAALFAPESSCRCLFRRTSAWESGPGGYSETPSGVVYTGGGFSQPSETVRSVYSVKLWPIPALFLLYPGLAGVVRGARWWRRKSGGCPGCGYDLTGNLSGTCPECGRPAQSVPH